LSLIPDRLWGLCNR